MDALHVAAKQAPDLTIRDLGLPDLRGTAVLRAIVDVPVIIGTARSYEETVIDLFTAGADDHVVMPFSAEQLAARSSALGRRAEATNHDSDEVILIGGLRIDLAGRTARLNGCDLELARREFDLLAYLAARPNVVVRRADLLRDVWGRPSQSDDQTIDVHVSWLRRKLGENAANPRYLRTVRGVGLKLVTPD
jgi:DNA-binding response OmpR family regulator